MFQVERQDHQRRRLPLPRFPPMAASPASTSRRRRASTCCTKGFIGVIGEHGLNEVAYGKVEDDAPIQPGKTTTGWLGITDKYWAATIVPPQATALRSRSSRISPTAARAIRPTTKHDPITIAPGQSARPQDAGLCRRQAGSAGRWLRAVLHHPAVRPSDRLGLVLLHHQADVQTDGFLLPATSAISASPS